MILEEEIRNLLNGLRVFQYHAKVFDGQQVMIKTNLVVAANYSDAVTTIVNRYAEIHLIAIEIYEIFIA